MKIELDDTKCNLDYGEESIIVESGDQQVRELYYWSAMMLTS
jgi:hypothetical protein